MKTLLLIFICMVSNLQAMAEEKLVTLLSNSIASYRDEMFRYEVKYTDVKLENGGLSYTQTMAAKDETGSIKVIVKHNILGKFLKASKHKVLTNEGIGKNVFVEINLPDETPESAISITTEIIDETGKKTTTTRESEMLECRIYFKDEKTAQEWSDELKRYLAK